MKQKSVKLSNLLLVLLFGVIYCVGNRLGLLIEYYAAKETNVLLVPFNALLDIFNSYRSDFMGFSLGWTMTSVLCGLGMMAGIFVAIVWGMSLRKNYREGEEHGSARYGDLKLEAEPLKDLKNPDNDMLLSKNVRISQDTRLTFLNDNILAVGGSGSGKTRFHVKPNVLQLNCNYVITDPKLSLVPEISNAFIEKGYDFKILNLKDMTKSMHYNPFKYIKKPNDILKFINNLVANTSKETSTSGGDDFFVKAEIALLTALSFYLMAVANPTERNIPSLLDLIDLAEASEEDENAESVLDIMFQELDESLRIMKKEGLLKKYGYDYLAVRQYNLYKKAAGKTAKSILISVGVRMGIFNIPEVLDLLSDDELDLETIGNPKKGKDEKDIKTVFFVGISDSDSTFTFIASILYQQLFDLLYTIADDNEGGRLPIHTRFMLDEFANIGKIPDFEIKIATMRSREISVTVILQNLAQLKNLYKDSWETIFGNCDSTLFLGGKEPSTLEYISKLIGNTTIDYLSYSENKGGQSSGSWSRSNQLISRPLLAPDEIGRLKKDECLVHVRGQHIFRDKKFDLMEHKNIDLTTDCSDKEKAKSNRYDPLPLILKQRKLQAAVNINNDISPMEAGVSFDSENDNAFYVNKKEIGEINLEAVL